MAQWQNTCLAQLGGGGVRLGLVPNVPYHDDDEAEKYSKCFLGVYWFSLTYWLLLEWRRCPKIDLLKAQFWLALEAHCLPGVKHHLTTPHWHSVEASERKSICQTWAGV